MIQLKQVFARIYEIVNFREHTYTTFNFPFPFSTVYNVNNDTLTEVSTFGF